MKSAVFVAAAVLSISMTGAASAGPLGGYLGLALGTQPGLNQELHDFANPAGRSIRGLGGVRFANISVEAALNSFDVATRGYGDRSLTQLSLAGKLSLPIEDGFEAFGRAGLEQTWFGLGDPRLDFSGAGYLIGLGLAYRIRLATVEVAPFIDYTFHSATLSNMVGDLKESSRFWALGTTVGF